MLLLEAKHTSGGLNEEGCRGSYEIPAKNLLKTSGLVDDKKIVLVVGLVLSAIDLHSRLGDEQQWEERRLVDDFLIKRLIFVATSSAKCVFPNFLSLYLVLSKDLIRGVTKGGLFSS